MMKRIATLKISIFLFVILALYTLFVMSPESRIGSMLRRNMPEGAGILDTKPGYTVNEAYQVLEKLGEAGRKDYLRNLLTIDVVFPVLYAFTFTAWISLLLSRIEHQSKLLDMLVYLPFLGGIFDLVENGSIAALIINFPKQLPGVAMTANIATMIKWNAISLMIYLIIAEVIILALINIIKIFKKNG